AGDGTLSVFFHAGPGSPGTGPDPFLPPVTLAVGPAVSDVAVTDADQDGLRDLLVADKVTGLVGVLRGLGGGDFAPPAWSRAGTGLYAVTSTAGAATVTSLEATAGVAAGRFTRDGLADLVTINPGSNSLDVLAGLGQGRFANPVAIPTRSPA